MTFHHQEESAAMDESLDCERNRAIALVCWGGGHNDASVVGVLGVNIQNEKALCLVAVLPFHVRS